MHICFTYKRHLKSLGPPTYRQPLKLDGKQDGGPLRYLMSRLRETDDAAENVAIANAAGKSSSSSQVRYHQGHCTGNANYT